VASLTSAFGASGVAEGNERPETIPGLTEKRAEIVEQIADLRAKLQRLYSDLEHVDAAIRLFDQNYRVDGLEPETCSPHHVTYRGELARTVLGLLREAPAPLTTEEIALHVMVERGKNTANNAMVKLMIRRAEGLLRHYRNRGSVRSIHDPMLGRSDLWELAL